MKNIRISLAEVRQVRPEGRINGIEKKGQIYNTLYNLCDQSELLPKHLRGKFCHISVAKLALITGIPDMDLAYHLRDMRDSGNIKSFMAYKNLRPSGMIYCRPEDADLIMKYKDAAGLKILV